ncbi:phospholipid-binding lipoprotein MlaA [uncultured Gammaproteobacteria bacterium]
MRKLGMVLAVICGVALPAAARAESVPMAHDPLEPFNRAMFSFNKGFLNYVINPLVDYTKPRLPESVITALGNAYSNLTEIEFILNNLLVGDPKNAAVSVGRFAINSTVGIAGIFDVAKQVGLERREHEFIESLCSLGVPPGPYVVLPLVGSANLLSFATLSGAIALEVYALSFISTTLAMADFIIIDLGGSAAALRYMNNIPAGNGKDPYDALRTDHMDYVNKGCATAAPGGEATKKPGAGA